MSWLDWIGYGFECAGVLLFLVSLGFWTANFWRSRRDRILDYSMFALHPLFLLCTVFTGVMLGAAVYHFRKGDMFGFRMSIGAAVMFLSLLIWNAGFVTSAGLYLPGAPCNPLLVTRENGFLLMTPQNPDMRINKPIIYENTPENRQRFSDLMK